MSVSTPFRLPQALTTLIGREREIAEIGALLAASSGSILTLVGPAGVGKTRLAVAVASAVADAFPDGVVYVDLATVADPAQILKIVANAFALPSDEDGAAQLGAALTGRASLLVLDNAEHLLEAGPSLNATLTHAPGLRLLVTSQAPFRVRGEREYVVNPLPVPPLATFDRYTEDELQALAETPSIALFTTRTQAVRPSFQLTSVNAQPVVTLCQRLDGLPLAIELAAARGNFLPPEALLARLSDSFRLLRGGPRNALERHQTLQAAIEWSYGLLRPEEALLLDRLSVFAGSFSLEAAEAVGGDDEIEFLPSIYLEPQPPLPARIEQIAKHTVFELLQHLADHSLVQRVSMDSGEPRFRLLEIIRQFAAERLIERGEGAATTMRHATWFRQLAESTWDERGAPIPELSWLQRLDADYDNMRAAVDYLHWERPAASSSMAAALVWFFYLRGRRHEGLQSIDRNTGSTSDLLPMARSRIAFARATLLVMFESTQAEGVRQLEALADELEPLGPQWISGCTLTVLGATAESRGEFARGLAYAARARPLLEPFQDTSTLANLDYHAALANFGLGNLDRARALASEVAGMSPDAAGINIAYANHLLGLICIAEGDQRGAATHLLRDFNFLMELGFPAAASEVLNGTAAALSLAGDAAVVARLAGAASRQSELSGSSISMPEKVWYDAAIERARRSLGETQLEQELMAGRVLSRDCAFELARQALEEMATPQERSGAFAPRQHQDTAHRLTERELETLKLLVKGYTDREIADGLHVSYSTARATVRNILIKLEVSSRTAATVVALREGLVSAIEIG